MSDEWVGFEIGDKTFDLHIFTDEEGEEALIIYPVEDGKIQTQTTLMNINVSHLGEEVETCECCGEDLPKDWPQDQCSRCLVGEED